MRSATTGLLALGISSFVMLGLTSQAAYGQIQLNDIFWNADPAAAADWNVDTNWIPAVVPSLPLGGERAVIDNGGAAFINTSLIDAVGGLRIDDGRLEIRDGGALDVVTDDDLDDPEEGIAFIGGTGRGQLDVLAGGAFNADTLTMRGAADSTLTMRGNATMEVTNDARLERIARIIGPDVSIEVGGALRMGGTFIPEITGANHSTIQVPLGNATLGGTLRPEFSGGFTPTLGDEWTLITAGSVSGSFASVDTSQAPALPRGATFQVNVEQGASSNVVLSLSNRLVLTVNRRTGAASFENVIGDEIQFDGYTIGSAGGRLDPGSWTSLQTAGVGDWMEANPTSNNVSELNPFDVSTLAVGQSFDIGFPYSFTPTAIGESGEDLAFSYHVPGLGTVQGSVEYSGPLNNMVLLVDPMTGDAAIQNQSIFSTDIDGYRISSASGSLLPGDGGWLSFQDSMIGAWNEANPTANDLSELNPLGSTVFNTNNLIEIGSPFDVGGTRDLVFEFRQVDGQLITGAVQYGPFDVTPMLEGDTNADGKVDIDDLNDVRNNFGVSGPADGTLPGDTFPFDGMVNIDDLNSVRNNFGTMAAPAPVPEPGAALLLGMSCALLIVRFARRARGSRT